MTTLRTFKFLGKAYSTEGAVTVTAVFNGKEVFSGGIPTTNDIAPYANSDLVELFSCDEDMSVTGNVPLVLSVSNGVLLFGAVDANYRGINVEVNEETGAVSILTPPDQVWAGVSNVDMDSDGKTNVYIDGVSWSRTSTGPENAGDWQYRISSGSTFSCDIFVDPDLIVTEWSAPE